MKTNIVVCGAFGRMGQAVIDCVAADQDFEIVGAVVRDLAALGQESCCPVKPTNSLTKILDKLEIDNKPSVIVDFSQEGLTAEHLLAATKYKTPILVATTGHGPDNLDAINKAAQKIPVILAPNTSVMANLMFALLKIAGRVLKDADAEILEIHHKKKRDTPSGTALAMERAIENGSGGLSQSSPDREIGVYSMRAGSVVGDHTAFFFSENERLEITHRAQDRRIFAQGALIAAKFLSNKKAGLYHMSDVLNLNISIENEACC